MFTMWAKTRLLAAKWNNEKKKKNTCPLSFSQSCWGNLLRKHIVLHLRRREHWLMYFKEERLCWEFLSAKYRRWTFNPEFVLSDNCLVMLTQQKQEDEFCIDVQIPTWRMNVLTNPEPREDLHWHHLSSDADLSHHNNTVHVNQNLTQIFKCSLNSQQKKWGI